MDDFYRNALAQGLTYQHELGRGFLPAELIEAIRALGQPPIPWAVELATFLDRFIDPVQKTRTFGVIIDTSASFRRWDWSSGSTDSPSGTLPRTLFCRFLVE